MAEDYHDDSRYSEEAREIDLRIIWRCSRCGERREDYPGCNEGGEHSGCGGEWIEMGESYDCGLVSERRKGG